MTILSPSRPIIAVCGATGFQGGSVVKHLLCDTSFQVRALTRKPNSAQAKELAKLGAEVVQADFDNLPSLCQAFRGCYGVFGVTDFFEAFEREAEQGCNIADAAKNAGVKHVVLSTAEETTDGVAAMKYKAVSATYLRESGIPFTLLCTAFYYSNLALFNTLTRDRKTGGWVFYLPFPTDIPIPSMSPKDIGAFVLAAFKNPSEWVGKDMKVANEYITPRQYAETFAEVTGSYVEIREVTLEDFLAMERGPFILQTWDLFKWFLDQYQDGKPLRNTELAHRLYPEMQTLRDFMLEHMEIPSKQPVMIQCVRTQELFS